MATETPNNPTFHTNDPINIGVTTGGANDSECESMIHPSKTYRPPVVNLTLFKPRRAVVIKSVVFTCLTTLWIPVVMVVSIGRNGSPVDGEFVAMIIGITFLILDFVFYIGRVTSRQFLITSPVGIEFATSSSNSFRCSWNNVIGPGKVRHSGYSFDGLMIRRPAVEMSTFSETMVQWSPWLELLGILLGQNFQTIDAPKYPDGIQVSLFTADWRTGQLGEQLRCYAPHLFGESVVNRPIPAPDTFPPSLYALTQSPPNRWQRTITLGVLSLQVALTVGCAWWWNGMSSAHRLSTDMDHITAVSFTPDGGRLLVVGSRFEQWQLPKLTLLAEDDHLSAISRVAFSPDGALIALDGALSSASVWGMTDGKVTLVHTLLPEREDTLAPWISSIAFAADDDTVAIGMENGTLRLWSVHDGAVRKTIQDNDDFKKPQFSLYTLDEREVQSLTFARDSSLLAFYDHVTGVHIWQLSIGTSRVIQPEDFATSNLAFAPDSQLLALGTYDGAIEIYRVVDGSLVFTLTQHKTPIASLAFTSDGRFLAVGGDDGSIYLWRMQDQNYVQRLRIHSKRINSLVFSPDNRTLATATNDVLRLWNVSGLLEAVSP